DPARRRRWYFARALVVFLDGSDRFTDLAVQGRVVTQLFYYRIFNALKLAFDGALGGFAPLLEQHFTIALLQLLLALAQGKGGKATTAIQGLAKMLQTLLARAAGKIE